MEMGLAAMPLNMRASKRKSDVKCIITEDCKEGWGR